MRANRFSMATALVFLAACCAMGQVIIPPPHPPGPRPRPRPQRPPEIREHTVKATLRNGLATTKTTLVCHNPNDRPFEGTFLFEVPGDAAIGKLTMMMNGKEVEAELLDADEARKIYEEIVRRTKDPALLEVAGERLIRARIFPIPPKGDQTITMTYSHAAPMENGLLTWRYPLKQRGPNAGPIRKLAVVVEIAGDLPIKSIVSPSHTVDVVTRGIHRATVSYEGENVTPDDDFALYVAVSEEDIGLRLMTHREAGKDGFFMALLGAGYVVDEAAPMPRKTVLFVIDTSGSMASDEKIGQVRKALVYCLEHLGEEDRFNVIDFSTTARTFRDGLVEARKATVEQAVAYVEKLDARGGTAIEKALRATVDMVKGAPGPVSVIFLTDGKPTIGTQDIGKLTGLVKDAGLKGLRLLAFGVGDGVNTHLLDKLTQANHGATTYVRPGQPLDRPIVALHNKLSYPALTGIKLSFGDLRVHDVFPQELPDLFHGEHLTVVGRYRGEGDHAVTLTGTLEGETRRVVHEGNFPARETTHLALPPLWATRKIGYLLDEMRLQGMNDELRAEVVRLSKEYGIITPYTSFLVAEDVPAETRPQVRRDIDRLRTATRNWRKNAEPAREALAARSGGAAVDAAESIQRLKEGKLAGPGLVEAERERTVRRVAGKAYFLIDGRWIVSTWEEDEGTRKVAYLSDAWFHLARKHPSLAKALALGPRVITEFEGTYYEVVEGEKDE